LFAEGLCAAAGRGEQQLGRCYAGVFDRSAGLGFWVKGISIFLFGPGIMLGSYFCVFALVPANVLLLDEASNHLDAATLEVLTGGQF
jgi:hypothetical protein